MPGIACFGDQYQCNSDQHKNKIFPLTDQSSVVVGGKPVVKARAMLPCGAVVASGSTSVLIDGKPVARVGDPVKHGSVVTGVIIEGSGNVSCG
jgi:uncharacterized Zn-binding protein involved in type VI secretion